MAKDSKHGKGTKVPSGGKRTMHSTVKSSKPSLRRRRKGAIDVYEYEDTEAFGDVNKFDEVDVYEYSLPENFEDEDIDEDEAFGEDDADIFDDIGPSSKRRRGGERNVDKDEEDEVVEDDDDLEDDEDESDGGEGHTLSEILDMADSGKSKNDTNNSQEPPLHKRRKQAAAQEDSDASFSSENEDPGDEDDGDDGRHEQLLEVVQSLGKQPKRQARREVATDTLRETVPESEYDVLTSNHGIDHRGPLQLSELVQPLEKKPGHAALRKQLDPVAASGRGLAVPIAGPAADRLERSAAYQRTSRNLSKWNVTVWKNRQADQLQFPLEPDTARPPNSAALSATFTPSTDLEKEVQAVLAASGLTEEKLNQDEQLQMNKLTPEQVMERQAKLAKLRSLMFQHELKLKRISKIKSKKYHRILKKDKERQMKAAVAAAQVDDEFVHEQHIQAEVNRAKERMTLKHKNRSKKMKRILEHGDREDPQTRQAIAEHLRIGEQLRAKMTTMSSAPRGSDSDSASGSDDDAFIALAKDDLAAHNGSADPLADVDAEPPKGLLGLKFMQRAMERKKLEMKELIKELDDADQDQHDTPDTAAPPPGRRALGPNRQTSDKEGKGSKGGGGRAGSKGGEEDDQDAHFQDEPDEQHLDQHEDDAQRAAAAAAAGVEQMARGKKRASTWDSLHPPPDDDDQHQGLAPSETQIDQVAMSASHRVRVNRAISVALAPSFRATHSTPNTTPSAATPAAPAPTAAQAASTDRHPAAPSSPASNPWLEPIEGEPQASKRKRIRKRKGRTNAAAGDATGEAATPSSPLPSASGSGSEVVRPNGVAVDDDDVLLDTTVVIPEPARGQNPGAEGAEDGEQQRLMQRAFAGPDLEQEFEAEKMAAIEAQLPHDDIVVLPGWGAWGGAGTRPSKVPKFAAEARRKLEAQRDMALQERKDRDLKHVVVDEAADTKVAKYTVPRVPWPFMSADQYERTVRNPLGRDWNTAAVHKQLVAPRIVRREGAIIDPIVFKKSKAGAQKSTRRPLGGKVATK